MIRSDSAKMCDAEVIRRAVARDLEARGVPTNPSLPTIGSRRGNVSLRDPMHIAVRLVQLQALGAVSAGAPVTDIRGWLIDHQLFEGVPAEERQLLSAKPSRSVRKRLSWIAEPLVTLGWVASLLDSLPAPTEMANIAMVGHVTRQMPPAGPPLDTFLRTLELRPTDQVAYETDFYYCLHWAIRDRSRRSERWANRDVVVERRRALEWCISSHEWADITLDT